MVVSGFETKSLLLTVLPYLESYINTYLSGFAGLTADSIITILSILIGLGGITVMAGGVVILTGHTSSGRLLIMLGGGAGVLGLLISFGLAVYREGLKRVLDYVPYWVGVAMAVVGRRLAKGSVRR